MEFNSKFDAKAIENEVRGYLDNLDLNAHLENELAGRDSIGYIEGPPTMNGEPHAGHLRGRIIKDLWYRFNTLRKKRVVFRAGWDTQGLPVELAAEKELGLTGSKAENLNKVGIERIVETCKKLILANNEKWVAADKLLGMSFNYEKAYWTFHDSYIEREWQYLRKAWENGILREWFRVVAYCPSCQTSLSNAEVNQGYENVEDPSFYYKVRLSDQDAFLVVWTTMPFTIVTDEMVGVNPDAAYNFVRIATTGELWVVGADRMEDLMKELRIDSYDIEKTVKGSELDGRHYVHPLLHMIPGLKELASAGSIHFVVAEDFVDIATGSGLVHLSPANGEEDFEIADKRGVPIFVPIDDKVTFTEKAGSFSGLFVRDADLKVVEAMKQADASVKIGRIKHQYPTCWRSHHKVVWLARREYFYIIEKLGSMPLGAAEKVDYFFEPPKNRFVEIIKEQVPWCISRERVWGTPLPIWSCAKCGHKDAVFSRDEIVKKATELPDGPDFELHRPWIDRIKIPCEKCGALMQREQFVLDTWHNSGAAPYASLTEQEYDDLIPASFLTEGIDQTRGWAYTLLMENVIMNQSGIAPFRSFLFQGHVLDEKGNKMSKSLGNVMDARALLSENPVDLIRLYFMWKSSPIESLNFSLDEMKTRPYQIVSTLHNLHVYFRQNSEFDKFDPDMHTLAWAVEKKLLGPTEAWLLSKMQRLAGEVTESFSRCRFHEGAKAIDEFVINQLSQTYVPLTRNIIWDDSAENLDRRLAVYAILGQALRQIDIMLHPLAPFISDYLYLTCFASEKKSILLEAWPERDERFVDTRLEGAFDIVKEIVSLANAARNAAGLKRRWPIREALICSADAGPLGTAGVSAALESQLNVEHHRIIPIEGGSQLAKVISLVENKVPVEVSVSLARKNVAPRVKADIAKVLKAFESVDKLSLLDSLKSGGYSLQYDEGGKALELVPSDVEILYKAAEGYSSSERGDLVVLISTGRDKALTSKGLLRDLARQLQQLRKERQYNPTHILAAAYVAGLEDEEISALAGMKDMLTYLVRVKGAVLSKEPLPNIAYKTVEIDGREFRISVE
ncbi:MAG TPA: isoleucine--tRNA ligase [Nitrososphaera sp.]